MLNFFWIHATKFLYTMNIFYTHWRFFQCMVNNIQIHIELFFKYDELLLNACWTKFLYMMNLFLYTLNIFWMYCEIFSSIWLTKNWNAKSTHVKSVGWLVVSTNVEPRDRVFDAPYSLWFCVFKQEKKVTWPGPARGKGVCAPYG